jgi:thiol-disulfide isomerase/thioredoxin
MKIAMQAIAAICTVLALCSELRADASVTLLVKSGYSSELKISSKPHEFARSQQVWKHVVAGSTTLLAKLSPLDVVDYQIQDLNGIINLWFSLEEGDSLAIEIDLDNGSFKLLHDKLGHRRRASTINDLYRAYLRRADSAASVLTYSVMQRYAKTLQDELLAQTKPLLDSMPRSKRYAKSKARSEFLATSVMLRYLQSDWSESTKEALCKMTMSVQTFAPVQELNDDLLSETFAHWFNILATQANECRITAGLDSVELLVVRSLSGRARAIAFFEYSKRQLYFSQSPVVVEALQAQAREDLTQEDLKRMFDALLDAKLAMSEGRVAPEMELPDTAGVARKLSDLKGKVVLIDFWGTWCQPCIRELPHLETLAKAYEGKDFQILGIALETKKVRQWQKFVRERALNGVQLYAESQGANEQLQPYNINSVPRYVLLDRQGKIISGNAPRPSNATLREMIDKALSSN